MFEAATLKSRSEDKEVKMEGKMKKLPETCMQGKNDLRAMENSKGMA